MYPSLNFCFVSHWCFFDVTLGGDYSDKKLVSSFKAFRGNVGLEPHYLE